MKTSQFVLKKYNLIYILLFSFSIFSQTKENKVLDSLYREDQFYIGIQYCSLNNRPPDIVQDKISLGFNAGFLRDFPINKSRTLSIAPGIGYAFKNYNSNLEISTKSGVITYSETSNATSNYLRMQYVDFPLEFRWRNSTIDSHKFWRVYTGVKLSKLIFDNSYYISPTDKKSVKDNPDLNKTLYSIYTSMGWNTWNIYLSYGLTPIFSSQDLFVKNINAIEIGLIFYIL